MAGGKHGLYTLLGASWHSIIVVANELPKGRATLWLRLLGRSAVVEPPRAAPRAGRLVGNRGRAR